MKRNKIFFNKCLLLFFACSLFFTANVLAQTEVRGTVTDAGGETMPGVTVMIRGTNIGTVTDFNGSYRLTVTDENATLVFSSIGYQTVELPLLGRSVIDAVLTEGSELIDEVVVVAYGTQRRQSITGSVAQVSGTELLKAPVGNISSRLGGIVPGVVTLQQSGQPGADAASIMVRGEGARYIVDGVQRQFNEIDPNEIETISVLKDASSASLYGLDATSVIIITTRRGKDTPSRISFTATYGVSQNALMLEMLNGPQYAYWYNLTRELDDIADGLPLRDPVFSQTHVEKMLAGVDGWGNTDWYKKTFGMGEDMSFNINATGGTEKIKYFVSIGNYRQNGNVNNFDYNRFNLRSNIDAEIAKNLEISFNIAGRVEQRSRPHYSAAPDDWNNIPQQAIRAHPYVPETWDNGVNGPLPVSTRTNSSYVSPLAASDLTGYNRVKTSIVETNVALNYRVPYVPGLSLRVMGAYDISHQTSKIFATPYYTYVANTPTVYTGNITYTRTNDARGETATLTEGLAHYTHFTTNASIRYENRFDKHGINALALAETIIREGNLFSAGGAGFEVTALDELTAAGLADRRTISGSSYQQRVAGFVGRINYDYDNKYLAEFSYRHDGSYLFDGMEKGSRWAPFPAGSLGWRISEEEWFQNINALSFINNVKLRGSAGLTSTTVGIRSYVFLDTMSPLTNIVVIGNTGLTGLNASRPANKKITWPKTLQYNGGIELTMWRGLLGLEFDVFYKYLYDGINATVSTYPPSYGGYVPEQENIDRKDYKGFEAILSHRNRIGDFSYRMSFNGTFTKRRWLFYSQDKDYTPDWQKLTGREEGALEGFIAIGLFKDEEDIANSATIPGSRVVPGDIKYLDRNGDGVITLAQDGGLIGKSAFPKFVGGFAFNADWKGIDVSFLLQGATGRDVALTGRYSSSWVMDNTFLTKAFYHGGNSPKYLIENSWRGDNPDAEFPRLAIVPASNNNAYSSSLWYRKGDYLRLKSAQIGYTLPAVWMSAAGIHSTRVYVEGQNLLTFSELTKYGLDPEHPGVSNGYYPQQRIISFGINVIF